MLREVKNGGFEQRGVWLWKRYCFRAGKVEGGDGIRSAALAAAERLQATSAVPVCEDEERVYWWALDRFWWEDEGLGAADVFALAYERRRRKLRTLERAHAVVATGAPPAGGREPIGVEVRRAVFERDGGRCVDCGADFDLQYDHVIPLALGGATTVQNLQVLCAGCNQRKGASLG